MSDGGNEQSTLLYASEVLVVDGQLGVINSGVPGRERHGIKGKGSRRIAPFPKYTRRIWHGVSDDVTSFVDDGDRVVSAGDIGNPVVEVREGEIKGDVAMENAGETVVCFSKQENCREVPWSPVGRFHGGGGRRLVQRKQGKYATTIDADSSCPKCKRP